MFHCRSCTAFLVVLVAVVALGLRQSEPKTGWLDRLVQYHKERFINKLRRVKPFVATTTTSEPAPFNAALIRKPEGFVDSKDWNYESVVNLMILLKSSEAAKPTLRALRRMLRPTRRIMMSMKDSLKKFPGLNAESNNLYYDIEYTSQEDQDGEVAPPSIPDDQEIVVITNPVEARLPSSRISVKLLREILEARALAARQMPSTRPSVIPWIPMDKTSKKSSSSTSLSPSSSPAEPPAAPNSPASSTTESKSMETTELTATTLPELGK